MEKKQLTREEKIAKNKRIAKRRKIKRFSRLSYLVLLASCALLFFIIKGFNALPFWALAIVGVLFLLMLLPLGFLALIPSIKNSAKQFQGVVCVLLSALVIFGCIKLPAYKGALEKVFVQIPSDGELNIGVYTLADGELSSIEKLSSAKVVIQSKLDSDYQNYAIKVVNKEIKDAGGVDIIPVEADTIYEAVDLLLAGSVDAIMLNESYVNVIKDNDDYREFDQKVQNIYTCTQKIKLNVDTASVSNITKEPFVVAITGVDEWGTSTLKPTATPRSDVNMLVGVNPQTKQILIITIPRDSYVGITRDGEIVGYDKLTHLTTLNNGMNVWIQTLNRVFGANVNYYLRVNYTSLRDVVNALGGIDVDNPYEFTTSAIRYYDDSTGKQKGETKTFAKGTLHLNGEEALGYCRERYSLPEGDISRNKHQAIVIKACIKKVCSVSVITKVDSLLKAVEGKFTTNIQMNDIYALAQMQLDDMGDWEIVQYSVTGSSGWGYSYVVQDELSIVELSDTSINKARNYIQKLLSGAKVVIE